MDDLLVQEAHFKCLLANSLLTYSVFSYSRVRFVYQQVGVCIFDIQYSHLQHVTLLTRFSTSSKATFSARTKTANIGKCLPLKASVCFHFLGQRLILICDQLFLSQWKLFNRILLMSLSPSALSMLILWPVLNVKLSLKKLRSTDGTERTDKSLELYIFGVFTRD